MARYWSIGCAVAVLTSAACAAREERPVPRSSWSDLATDPVVWLSIEELCVTTGDAEPRCTDESTGSAHLTVADGSVELHLSDAYESRYTGRWGHEREDSLLLQLRAHWPLGEAGHVQATHAVLDAPVMGTCAANVGSGFGPCRITEHAQACSLSSVTTEVPLVEATLSGRTLTVVFEAHVADPPGRCCKADIGCEDTDLGTFSPSELIVRGELRATLRD